MRVLGFVTEYNPFHYGHLAHLTESKRLCAADCTVCVMSGNFTQRGEPAIVDKWARAGMALAAGIDLVLELPVVYAMSSAEYFASGAVKILDSTGIVDFLSFGSESGDIEALDRVAEVFLEEPPEFVSALKNALAKGLSYPAAREEGLRAALSDDAGVIDSPNNILGIEYLKALHKQQSSIKPLTIKRMGGAYRESESADRIPGATAIRNRLQASIANTGGLESLKALLLDQAMMPQYSADILLEEFNNGRGPVFIEHFEGIVIALLRKADASSIADTPDISEGLENRIKAAADGSGTLTELLEGIYTRRYPATRVRRALMHILTSMTDTDFQYFNANGGPQYIRILGFNDTGRELLSIMRDKATLPVITKYADRAQYNSPLISRMVAIEAASTDIYVLAFKNPDQRKAGREFTQNVVRR